MTSIKVGDLIIPKLKKDSLVNGHRLYPTPETAFHLSAKNVHTNVPGTTDRLLVVSLEERTFEDHTIMFAKLQNVSSLKQEGWVEAYYHFDQLWEVVARADEHG